MDDAKRIAIGNTLQEALVEKNKAEDDLRIAEGKINVDEKIDNILKRLIELDDLIPESAGPEKKELMRDLENLLKEREKGKADRLTALEKLEKAEANIEKDLNSLTFL